MTGLEKMKSQILSEARALADNKVEEAKADAQKITSQAEAEAEKSSELAHLILSKYFYFFFNMGIPPTYGRICNAIPS